SPAAKLWARLRGLPEPLQRAASQADPDMSAAGPPQGAQPPRGERREATLGGDHVYDTPFYRRFRSLVDWSVAHRFVVIGGTLAVFATAMVAFRVVPQQFFPSSSRPELMVDMRLPEGSSFEATLAESKRMETILDAESGIESYIAYVGVGSPRFYLPLDQQLQSSNFAQFVLVAPSIAER